MFKSENGTRDSGKERFYRIIISTSTQVIWNARCECVIQKENDPFSPIQIQNRWRKKGQPTARTRLLDDSQSVQKESSPERSSLENMVGCVIENEQQLPRDWTEFDGVLVGME